MSSRALALFLLITLPALLAIGCRKPPDGSAAPASPFTLWKEDLGAASVAQYTVDGSGNWFIPAQIQGLRLEEPMWERDISKLGSTKYVSAAGMIFYSSSRGYLGAIDAKTGKTAWENIPVIAQGQGTDNLAHLAVTQHCLAVAARKPTTGGEVRFYSPETGALLHVEPTGYEIAMLLAVKGLVFAVSSSGEVTSFSEKTGSRVSHTRQITSLMSAASANDRLVMVGRERAAFSLDLATLEPLGARMFNSLFYSPFSLNGEVLLFSGEEPQLIALNPERLEQTKRFPLEGRVNLLPAGKGNRIYFGEVNGKFRSFDIAAGEYAWTSDLEASCYVFMVFENCVIAVADYTPVNAEAGPQQQPQAGAGQRKPSWYAGEGGQGFCVFMLDAADGSVIYKYAGAGYMLPQLVTQYGIIVRTDPAMTLASYPYSLTAGK